MSGDLVLRNQDCLEFLKTLEDNSIDLFLNDPPYFEISKEKWDHQWESEDAYLSWCNEWTKECARIVKPNRVMMVWGTTKTDTFLKYKLNVLNNYLDYQSWLLWCYNWGGRSKLNFARKHEDLLVYSKGKEFLFNADAIRIEYKMKKNVREGATNNPLGTIPVSWMEKNNHTCSKEYINWHPNQKPFLLLERFIKAYTNEGDIVCDIFSGSGSTMISAYNTNRKFIGCERDCDYYHKSLERLECWKSI